MCNNPDSCWPEILIKLYLKLIGILYEYGSGTILKGKKYNKSAPKYFVTDIFTYLKLKFNLIFRFFIFVRKPIKITNKNTKTLIFIYFIRTLQFHNFDVETLLNSNKLVAIKES